VTRPAGLGELQAAVVCGVRPFRSNAMAPAPGAG